MTRRLASSLLFATCLLGSVHAFAQSGRVDIERFTPAVDSDGFIGIDGTRTPGSWNFTGSLSLGYEWAPLSIPKPTMEDEEIDLIEHKLSSDFSAQLGIGGRIAFSVGLPVVWWQSIDSSLTGIRATGIGNPRIGARLRIIGESGDIDRDRHEGPGLALAIDTTIPVGATSALAAESSTRLGAKLLGSFHIFGFGAGAFIGYRHRFDDASSGTLDIRSELSFGLAGQVPVFFIPNTFALLEFRAITDAYSPFADQDTTSLEMDAGVKWALGSWGVTTAVGFGINDAVGTPPLRLVSTLYWAPSIADADRDGIPDERDQCVHLAEDVDGFEDGDGCLDPDNDNDLIPDADDRCPNVAAEEGMDEDEDGCTDETPTTPSP